MKLFKSGEGYIVITVYDSHAVPDHHYAVRFEHTTYPDVTAFSVTCTERGCGTRYIHPVIRPKEEKLYFELLMKCRQWQNECTSSGKFVPPPLEDLYGK